MKYAALLVVALLLTLSCSAPPLAQKDDESDKDQTWQDTAKAADLAEADIKRLERDKVLVTNQTFRQSFDAYIGAELPVFITSDAVLNGFHVLFEESILRLETANARQVRPVLLKIWEGLKDAGKDIKGKPELLKAAQFRAKAVIAVALKLYGEKVEFPKDIEEAAQEQVKLILAGNATGKPKWLGEPDAGFMAIDYARFTPRGFYTRSEVLQKHFRALSWLQAIPFRVDIDEELLAAYLLGDTITYKRWAGDFRGEKQFTATWRCYSEFLGTGDNWDLVELEHKAQFMPRDLDGNDLKERRQSIWADTSRGDGQPVIEDQLRFVPDDPAGASEPQFRIVSAYRLPDAVMFARTTDPRIFKRALPTGLEVAALLGSKFAAGEFKGDAAAKLTKTIEAAKPLIGDGSLYAGYLHCLRALADEPEPDGPELMTNEVWQAKQCNTLLAGWAQMRHTFSLQAKMNVMYAGLADTKPGFVEPEPEFFSRLGDLVERTQKRLDQSGAFAPDIDGLAATLRAYAVLIRRIKPEENGRKALEKLTREEYETLDQGFMMLVLLAEVKTPENDDKDFGKDIAATADKADELAKRLETGEFRDVAALEAVLRESGADIAPLWEQLRGLVRRLESIAHKQLRKVAFSDAENRFIKKFGEQLAGVMLYGGNSWLTPRDDSPRAVSVFHNPNTGERLHVGIDRARAIYVLYPWGGKEILCRGAVMPYHEFTSKEPLTDAAFKGLLDSDKRPKVPAWFGKVAGEIGAADFAKKR